MEWIGAVVVVIAAYWWFILRQGNLSFWKVAAKHPDQAYQFFKDEECWFIDDVPADIESSQITGPFKLFVPSIDSFVAVYALADEIERSEEKFLQQVK